MLLHYPQHLRYLMYRKYLKFEKLLNYPQLLKNLMYLMYLKS